MASNKYFSNYLREHLIKRYIGQEIWNQTKNKETRLILMDEALKTFRREIVTKWGNQYNWFKDWCKRNGYGTPNNYYKECALNKGFDSITKYRDSIAKKKGFKDNNECLKKRIKERGFKSTKDYMDYLARKKGFKDSKGYNKDYRKRKKRMV